MGVIDPAKVVRSRPPERGQRRGPHAHHRGPRRRAPEGREGSGGGGHGHDHFCPLGFVRRRTKPRQPRRPAPSGGRPSAFSASASAPREKNLPRSVEARLVRASGGGGHMKIGIIGAGNVGSSLGGGLAREGHSIVYGVRDPASDKHAALKGPNVDVRSVREAVEAADPRHPRHALERGPGGARGGGRLRPEDADRRHEPDRPRLRADARPHGLGRRAGRALGEEREGREGLQHDGRGEHGRPRLW
jgi:hypothetical protein